jgi:hypothetical protein
MAASAAELPAIICSASDPAPADPAQDRPSSGKAAHDCCGTLCRLASAAMPAILDGNAGFVRFEAADPVDASRPAASVSRTSLRGLIGEPRAPPVSV